MSGTFDLHEFSLVVVGSNHNPTILNPDFLKHNAIVPDNWELAGNPVCAEILAQVKYTNGVAISAQFDKLIFAEPTTTARLDGARIPGIAVRYVATLPHVVYTAVGINPRGFVIMDSMDEVESFISNRYLSAGPWKTIQGNSAKLALKCMYELNDGTTINIIVEGGTLDHGAGNKVPAVMFAANFHREIKAATPPERNKTLKRILNGWRKDVDEFMAFINGSFLQSDEGE